MSTRRKQLALALGLVLVLWGPISVYAADDADARLAAVESEVAALTEKVEDLAKAMDIWLDRFETTEVERVEPESFVAGYKRAKQDECH